MSAPNMYIFPSNSFIDLTIYQFGHQDCPPFHTFGPAIRNHFLFHYVHSGKGTLRVDCEGKTTVYEIKKDEGFLIWPKQVTSYAADEMQPWSYSWVEFGGLKAKEILLESGLSVDNPVYKGKKDEFQQKMEEALRFIAHNPNASSFKLIGHCFLFLSHLAESSIFHKKIARSSLQDFYINEVLLYIENHYNENIRVEDIAAFCHLDRSHVGKVFKSTMGISLRDYLIHFRINKACELMKATNHSIGEIGGMVGYPNMFNFSRAFKSVMGTSPRQWREENRLR